MAAAAMAVAHSRGLFELDGPVADYWPEFQQWGKRQITVRQLLAHQGGLIAIDQPIAVPELADHDALAEILAQAEARLAAWRETWISHAHARLVSKRADPAS